MKLKEYRKKRDFKKTSEPKGKTGGKNIFVVQKHDASHLHYDFRLMIDGVLKSWAVPKGPSLNPKDKRLAIETEDHPADYSNFEGIIEEGYGKGTVMLWDKGSFKNFTEKDDKNLSLKDAYNHGYIAFELKGKKLKGRFAITRFKEDKWLLMKKKDSYSDARVNILKKDKSVKSGKSLKEIEKK